MGVPDIINYTKQDYNGGTQSWDLKQDNNGILYFANNDGLLTFDGNYWKVFHLPNRTHVRSLEIGNDNRIYIGAQDEVGYFMPDKSGRLAYTSLKKLLPIKEQSLGEVWDIVKFGNDLFFRSDTKILQFKNNEFIIHKPLSQWRYLGVSNGVMLAQDRKNGLFCFTNNKWQLVINADLLPDNFYVTSFLPLAKDSSIITSVKDGIFILTGNHLLPFTSADLSSITDKLVFSACLLDNGNIALATRLGGCYVINKSGGLIQHFSNREGLQNSNVYHVFSDKNGNLWLCLDNGIDFIAYNNAIKHIYPESQSTGSGYTSIIFKNQLYLGTSTGLYKTALGNESDISFEQGNFEPVKNTGGQVWNLTEINDQLLLAHHEGAFVVEGNQAKLLSNWTGYWGFIPISNIPPSQVIVAGNYKGISFFKFQDKAFISIDSNLVFESARFLAVDNNNKTVWVGHPYKGMFKLQWINNNNIKIKQYTSENAPLGINNNFLFKVRNSIVLTTEKGVYEYNAKLDKFEPSVFFSSFLKNIPISYLKEDASGNIWFVSGTSVGVIDMSIGQPKVIFIPELTRHIVSGFEHINPVNSKNIFIGGEKGFYHINFEQYKKNSKKEIQTCISTVRAIGKTDSLLFGGYYESVNSKAQAVSGIPTISYGFNSFHFEYSSTLYGQQSNIEYSYYLKGFDNQWSDWIKKTEKDYTNLPPGNYTFSVKSRNGRENESTVSSYSFKVLPPWYRAWWAYLIYILFFVGCFYAWYKQQQRKFLRQQQKRLKDQQEKHAGEQKHLQYLHQLEIERNEKLIIQLKNDKLQQEIENNQLEEEKNHQLYLHQLELAKNEKEIIRLRNEKLQVEIENKNSELASNAMSLVQRSELLSSIKEELLRIKNQIDPSNDLKEFKKVISIINKELEINNDWEQFAVHFDHVHSNFLITLKENYPNLSPAELKLCAYLRLNLSTKEIAQLMNITIRGVETSRYRLRKKFNLTNENLFDFLLTVSAHENGKSSTT